LLALDGDKAEKQYTDLEAEAFVGWDGFFGGINYDPTLPDSEQVESMQEKSVTNIYISEPAPEKDFFTLENISKYISAGPKNSSNYISLI
jgi:hypothetical protein